MSDFHEKQGHNTKIIPNHMVLKICSNSPLSFDIFSVLQNRENKLVLIIFERLPPTQNYRSLVFSSFFWTFPWLLWRWRWRWRCCMMRCTVAIRQPSEGKMKAGRWMQKRENQCNSITITIIIIALYITITIIIIDIIAINITISIIIIAITYWVGQVE